MHLINHRNKTDGFCLKEATRKNRFRVWGLGFQRVGVKIEGEAGGPTQLKVSGASGPVRCSNEENEHLKYSRSVDSSFAYIRQMLIPHIIPALKFSYR